MREILFRGKRIDNQQWIQSGSFVRSGDDGINWDYFLGTGKPATHSIDSYGNICASVTLDECLFCMVDSETVGQFTGLADKNGKKIFEGDVVRQTFEKSVPLFASSWGSDEYEDICGDDVGAVVIIPSKGVCIKNPIIHREVDGEITQHGEKAKMYKPVCSSRCEVIGNIHDNPELLEEGDS